MTSSGPIFVPGESLASHVENELAWLSVLAMGRTAPNPAVAAVVAVETQAGLWALCGGCTEVPGKRHAEIVALDAAGEMGILPSHMYVTLEPCSRFGRTPPCTSRILSTASLEEVTYYTDDITLAGEGRRMLETGGRRVVNRTADRRYTDAFLHGFTSRAQHGRPRLHVKVAHTSDGVIGHRSGRLLISGQQGLRFGMLLRAKCDGVLVGPGTTALDIPGLDFRRSRTGTVLESAPQGGTPVPLGVNESGQDLLTESILQWSALLDMAADEVSYQPQRIFILGRRFPDSVPFFAKQGTIAERTGRNAVYFTLKSNMGDWPEVDIRAVLPDLDDMAFSRELRRELGALGLNDVLVESGAGLLRALGPFETGDRFYVLESEKSALELSGGRGGRLASALIRLPQDVREIPVKAAFRLGADRLSVAVTG
ncbi:MAG: hypothetical protein HY042_00190 [Spirochaetia bacterium]|nr:hypothetical protein [Spirochaetia bacterium]